jgi:hypothetical protein
LTGPNSQEVLELYRGRTDSTIPEIKTSRAVRSRYNDLKSGRGGGRNL